LFASLLSALIPGLGKVYSNEISDGIFSFLATGLLSYLAYDNFKADHRFRGWLFTGLASIFYVGNIYGSYAAAQIFNAQVKYDFNLRLDSFIKSNNYFIPEYDFCK
jgi:TM2 domain-containing membrane protein YozV